MGEFFRILELKFLVKSFEKILQLATFFRQKDETFKMLYRSSEAQRGYSKHHRPGSCPSVSSFIGRYSNTPCVGFATSFGEFGDSYTFLDVYNIFEKLKLIHAHYEASTMKPPSHSQPGPPLATPTISSHSSSRAKAVHLVTPILPSCNYCGNPTHKASECNIPS